MLFVFNLEQTPEPLRPGTKLGQREVHSPAALPTIEFVPQTDNFEASEHEVIAANRRH